MARFNESPAIDLLGSGKFTLAHYKSTLREIYHYSKEDPQLQALASVYFRGSDRQLVELFLRHALAEVGHDQIALKDLQALGEDISEIATENPLPATIALTSYPFYEISFRNPVAYLGYLYFLEHMPTLHGATYAKALTDAGVPNGALGFLKEHIAVDTAHNKLMVQYIDKLLHDARDADAAVYAMHVTADLYAKMLWGCVERVETPTNFGRSWAELARMRKSGKGYA